MNILESYVYPCLSEVSEVLVYDKKRQRGLFGAGPQDVTAFLFILIMIGFDNYAAIRTKAGKCGLPEGYDIQSILEHFEGHDRRFHLWRRDEVGLYRPLF